MSDDWDDDEYADYDVDLDADEDFEDAWYECPLCGAEVYEDANVCPACDEYMVPRLTCRSDLKPLWYVILSMAGIIAVILALSGFMMLF